MSTQYDRAFGEMTMDCDGDDGSGMCTENLVLTGEFRECVDRAKAAGWTMRPDSEGEWKHFCPGCTLRNSEWN